MVIFNGASFADWIRHFLACMGSCFGCCAKPAPIIAVDEPSKGLKIRGQVVKKPSMSEEFGSSSTCDLDYSAVQSQRSISSMSASNQNVAHAGGVGSNNDFVNRGLLLWHQNRLQWVGDSTSRTQTTQRRRQRRLSWTSTYESLLGTKNPYPRPIPLCEMVDFLVEVWEHEGLYD